MGFSTYLLFLLSKMKVNSSWNIYCESCRCVNADELTLCCIILERKGDESSRWGHTRQNLQSSMFIAFSLLTPFPARQSEMADFAPARNQATGRATESDRLLPATGEIIISLVDDYWCRATVCASLCENMTSSTKPEVTRCRLNGA